MAITGAPDSLNACTAADFVAMPANHALPPQDRRDAGPQGVAHRAATAAQSPVARQLRVQAVQRARRARFEALVITPLLVGVIWAYSHRRELFGVDMPVRIASAIVLVILGWAF